MCILSTVGNCTEITEGYEHSWFSPVEQRHYDQGVARPEVVCRFFAAANRIDVQNHRLAMLALYEKWPTSNFWKKLFVAFEIKWMADLFDAAMVSAPRESPAHILEEHRTSRIETLGEFVTRIVRNLLPTTAAAAHDAVRGLAPTYPLSIASSASVTTRSAKRRDMRTCPDRFSWHPHVPVERGVYRGGRGSEKGVCLVCKAKKNHRPDKEGSYPRCTNQCSYCEGHVHGPDNDKYPLCWQLHITHSFQGLKHSGERVWGDQH